MFGSSGMWLLGVPAVVLMLLPLTAGIFYILTVQRALRRCEPWSRGMMPGFVWLLLVPFVNLIWHFFVVTHLARSLRRAFLSRGIPLSEPEPGKVQGWTASALAVLVWVPGLGMVMGVAALVCWIGYWRRIAAYSAQLAQAGGAAVSWEGLTAGRSLRPDKHA